MRRLPVLAAVSLVLLWGCLNAPEEKRAGGEEFPNEVYAMVQDHMGRSQGFSALGAVPDPARDLLKRRNVAAHTDPPAPLAKYSGASQTIVFKIDYSDTAAGILKVFHQSRLLSKETFDTVEVRWDAQARDSIKDNENIIRMKSVSIFTNGKVEAAEITDADGDGIINAVPGGSSVRRIDLYSATGDSVERAILAIGAGPDADFEAEADNLTYLAEWSKSFSGETVATAQYGDADGDGIIIDNAALSLVDLTFLQIRPQTKPEVDTSRMEIRMRIKPLKLGEEIVKFSAREILLNGRVRTVDLFTPAGDTVLTGSDTLKARLSVTSSSPTDTLDSMEVVYLMSPGKDFNSDTDDILYAFDVVVRKKLGEERKATFTFLAEKPIPSGQKPTAGDLQMTTEFKDGSSIMVEGAIGTTGLDVIFKNRQGKSFHVIWSQNGTGKKLEPLD